MYKLTEKQLDQLKELHEAFSETCSYSDTVRLLGFLIEDIEMAGEVDVAKDSVSIRIDTKLLMWIDEIAEREGRSRSWVINDIISELYQGVQKGNPLPLSLRTDCTSN